MPMLDPEDAWQAIRSTLPPAGPHPMPLQVTREEALGRVLATDISASVEVPPADVSAMDGYVLGSAVEAGATLPVIGISSAGHPPEFSVAPGQAAKIMTGAVVPRGADRVVPIELTDGGKGRVCIHRSTEIGAHIRRQGEVLTVGQPLLPQGQILGPGALSVLASHGYSSIPVARPPKVAVLTTGDEVIPPESEPGPGQLRDSNTAFLLAAVRSLGLQVESLGIASDDRGDLERRIRRGLEADVLLLCGGVSKGDYDFVEEVLQEVGCQQLFDAVAIQPGKPLVASTHERPGPVGARDSSSSTRGWIFGLPGNPASVMVTFWLFVRPALRCLSGIEDGYWRGALSGVLDGSLPPTKGRDRFVPARVRSDAGTLRVEPLGSKGSHDTLGHGFGTALVRVPRNRPATPAGESCQLLPYADWPMA